MISRLTNIKQHSCRKINLQHKQLLIKNGISQENTEDFGFSTKEITQLLKLFTEAYGSLRISPIPAIPLEIAVIEFYNLKQ